MDINDSDLHCCDIAVSGILCIDASNFKTRMHNTTVCFAIIGRSCCGMCHCGRQDPPRAQKRKRENQDDNRINWSWCSSDSMTAYGCALS
ncbi:hypothetical protein ACA910_001203 [Epithemia clementina (nom. ined.)]